MEKRYREDDMEIDLLELLFEFKKRAWVIILAAVLGCLGAGAYSRLILTPVYTSTAMVYVLSKETTLTSLADLQIGSQLTKDYSVMYGLIQDFTVENAWKCCLMMNGFRPEWK